MVVPVFNYASLDSTSKHVVSLLKEKKAHAPFAVIAEQQSAGRGRRGRCWESPRGNLYLSIALPAPSIPHESAGLIPLGIASSVCEYLTEHFGFRATLKWPNDILFGGRKLAGILCESTVSHQKITEVIVGIGLNVAVAPQISRPDQTTCLHDLGANSSSANQIGQELVDHLVSFWEQLHLGTILAAANAYSPPIGSIWLNPEGECRKTGSIQSDGSLALYADGKPVKKINSAEHDYRWVYLGDTADENPLITADIGNSVTKIAVFQKANSTAIPTLLSARNDNELAQAIESIKSYTRSQPWPIFTISVNEQRMHCLNKSLEKTPFYLAQIQKTQATRLTVSQYRLEDLGIDRLALCEGILAEDKTMMPKIAISFGTATTIDVLSPENHHLGGWILPGMHSQLQCLHTATAALPMLNPKKMQSFETFELPGALGLNTEDAMLKGLGFQTVSILNHLSNWVSLEWPEAEPRIYASGGAASFLNYTGLICRNDLVSQGIRAMALGGVF